MLKTKIDVLQNQIKQSGLTQVQFACKCGIHPTKFNRILGGETPSVNNIVQLCTGLNMQLEELFFVEMEG